MYQGFLHLHNFLRWLILLAGLLTVIKAFIGWLGSKNRTNLDNILGVTFVSLLDLQVIIGFVLYFILSPVTRTVFHNFGAAMKNPGLRFYAVEHILTMVIALVIIHLARNKEKRAATDEVKHRVTAIFYTIGLLFILVAIPWDRALFF
jgi:hypothetical protein